MNDIGEHVSTSGEAASDDSGMSVEDAVTSAYDDHDRAENGIAEGERTQFGQHLKTHADAAGTTVIDGVNSLLAPAIALRTGDAETRRNVIGQLIDDYDIRPEPSAVPAHDEFGDPLAAAAPVNREVQTFLHENPLIANDPALQDSMLNISYEASARGENFNLEGLAYMAMARDPRFAGEVRQHQEQQAQAKEADHVAKAKAANVQVSGSGHSAPTGSGQSDDIDDIIGSQIPRNF